MNEAVYIGPDPKILQQVKAWRELYEQIVVEKGKPLNNWEVTALLEIYGLRDVDAAEHDAADLFELGRYLTPFIEDYKYEVKTFELEVPPSKVKRIIQNYLEGMAFALPMLLQVFFTLVIGYGIWSSLELDVRTSTAIAMGTFAALVVTGGPAQAIGRKGLFYIKMEEYNLAYKITKKLFRYFVVQIAIVGLLVLVFNLFFQLIPTDMLFHMFVYYILLSLLFTTFAIFYMMELYGTISFYVLLGIFLVYLCHSLIFHLGIIYSQIISLIITDIVVFFDAFRRVKKLTEKSREKEGDAEPRLSLLFYSLNPYMLYGTFYFMFLVTDRLLAWSAIPFQPYYIWFNVRDEIGLDWALIVLILLIGLSEVIIYEFMYRVNEDIISHPYFEARKFNRLYSKFFIKFNIIFFIIAVFVILLVYWSIRLLQQNTEWDFIDVFFVDPTPMIFIFAAISYAFVANALTNILFFFSYSRYISVLKGIIFGLIVNFLVGLLLSRMLGYQYATVGLLVGSIVFWLFVIRFGRKFFKNLDYYYYSAY